MVKDPVCGALVYEPKAAARTEYQGRTYVFCSPFCQLQFEQDPARYREPLAAPPGTTGRVMKPDHDGTDGP